MYFLQLCIYVESGSKVQFHWSSGWKPRMTQDECQVLTVQPVEGTKVVADSGYIQVGPQ